MKVLLLIAIIIFVIVLFRSPKQQTEEPPRQYTEMRCPTCGAPVRNYGDRWECTWCSDFGRIEKQ